MKRVRVAVGALFLIMGIVIAGCVQEIERPPGRPTSTTSPVAAPTTPPTSLPTLDPTETPLPTFTPTATLEPTATATLVALEPPQSTVTPVQPDPPTLTPSPTTTSVPEPTATARTLPTSTPTSGESLFLDVQGPLNGENVQVQTILVYGFTNPGATLTINGSTTSVNSSGQFQKIVQLKEGTNIIDIVAKGGANQEQSRRIAVTRLPLQPFILIVTRPANLSVVDSPTIEIIGVTSPQAIVTVNGVTIDVNIGGIFETTVSLKPDLNTIDVLATNVDGDVKSTSIAVFYAPQSG